MNHPHQDALARLILLCQRFEGLRLRSYLCPAGVWTIGYGATGSGIGPGLVWTKRQAAIRLMNDADKFLKGTLALCPNLSGDRLAAISDFAFNLGLGRLRASTLRRKINEDDFNSATKELAKWVRGGGKILPGLIARRSAEIALL